MLTTHPLTVSSKAKPIAHKPKQMVERIFKHPHLSFHFLGSRPLFKLFSRRRAEENHARSGAKGLFYVPDCQSPKAPDNNGMFLLICFLH